MRQRHPDGGPRLISLRHEVPLSPIGAIAVCNERSLSAPQQLRQLGDVGGDAPNHCQKLSSGIHADMHAYELCGERRQRSRVLVVAR